MSTGSVDSVWIIMIGPVPVGIGVKIRRVTITYNISHQEVHKGVNDGIAKDIHKGVYEVVSWSYPDKTCGWLTGLAQTAPRSGG